MTALIESQASDPLVSVIVPTYNYAHFIEGALDSLRSQSYQNWECLVVDDDSTDSTAEVVSRVAVEDSRIKFFQQNHQRQAAAKNLGLRHSTGQYIQFLDSDDRIEPRKLESQVDYLERHSEVDIVYGSARYFTSTKAHGNPQYLESGYLSSMPKLSGRGREIVASMLRQNNLVINAALTRRSVVADVGPFDEQLPPAEDWDFWLRCACAGKSFHYEEVEHGRALLRVHDASSSRDRVGMYKSMLLMRAKFEANHTDAELLALNKEMRASDEGNLGIEAVVNGNRWKGARGCIRAARLEQKARWRAKWLVCAAAAPFLPKHRMPTLLQTSLTAVTGFRKKVNVR